MREREREFEIYLIWGERQIKNGVKKIIQELQYSVTFTEYCRVLCKICKIVNMDKGLLESFFFLVTVVSILIKNVF